MTQALMTEMPKMTPQPVDSRLLAVLVCPVTKGRLNMMAEQ